MPDASRNLGAGFNVNQSNANVNLSAAFDVGQNRLNLKAGFIAGARWWVGVNQNWHAAANWSLVSGGPGGAGVPLAKDNVFVDGNGFALCWAATPIVCANMTLMAAATEMVILDQGGVINGDFEIHGGTFSPTGGGGWTVNFKGNWLNTGGSFSVGTGVGIDPTCEFSGIGKTYALNQAASSSFQHVLISGELTVSGTRLGQMNISQNLSVTGIMTINKFGLTICDVDLAGFNAGFGVFTGEIKGTGRMWWQIRDNHVVPDTGTIRIRYWRYLFSEPDNKSLDIQLSVDGWNLVNQDWTHKGADPWIDIDDADTNRISIPAVPGSVGLNDEEYTFEDLPAEYTSVSLTNLRVHLVGRLYDGVGGHALIVAVRAFLWDGAIWQDGGTAFWTATNYVDRTCSTSLHASINTLAKVNAMKLKLVVDAVVNGGANKGGVAITHAYVDMQGTYYVNPIVTIAPRTYLNPCEVEFEYTDDAQTFQLENGTRHYFNRVSIRGDDSGILTAWFDCATYIAEMWCEGTFDINRNAFPNATFTIKFGDGTHVFRGSVDFYFSFASLVTQLVVDPGEGTLLLYPKGRQLIPIPPP